MRLALILVGLLIALPAASLETVWGESSGGRFTTQDIDNDGLYEFARADTDWDLDGTGWKTCDCGGSTTPGFSENYICGTYRTSATDDTPVDYSAGDAAGNPTECRFHGERVWDDITDDIAALEDRLAPGAKVYFPQGIYPVKSTLVGASSECWNSSDEAYTQTCKLDSDDSTYVSAILMRKDSLHFSGAGGDATGERDLKRTGTWMTYNKSTERAWTLGGGGSIIPAGFCMGYLRTATPGACGEDIYESTDYTADILLNIEMGYCADTNDDGTCDNGSVKANINVDDANVLCVDDAGGAATAMSKGQIWSLTMPTLGGGIVRQLMRVDDTGAACGGTSTGLLVTFGDVQLIDDVDDRGHPQWPVYQVFGSESSDAVEAATNATITGPINMDRWVSGQIVENFTFAHHNYWGEGTCTSATDTDCDNGPVLTIGSGANPIIRKNAFVHINTTYGSGGALNFEPYSISAVVEDNWFAYSNGGALIDLSNTVMFRRNAVFQNTALNDVASSGTDFNANYLIRMQGYGWKIQDNRFEQNYLPYEYNNMGIIEALVPFGWIEGNVFTGSNATGVAIQPGVTNVTISNNEFHIGAMMEVDTSDSEMGVSIKMDGTTDAPLDNINIFGNRFLGGGRYTGGADTGEAIGNIHIQIGSLSPNSTSGEIGPNGVMIRDNFVYLKSTAASQCSSAGTEAACDSAFIGFRGCDDPDNAKVFLDGNVLNTGRLGFCLALPAAAANFALDIGANGGTSDDGIGLMTCGVNRVGGTWYQARIAAEGGRSNPSECAAAW